jgi:Permuted papain-like amidase enzyme, YaeF/YiiX, C92 family
MPHEYNRKRATDGAMASSAIDTAELQIGDIVFIRVANFLYRRVADATMSWTSHVGMIHRRDGDDWLVAESAVPRSRYCPLRRFIRRSEAGRCAILRLKSPLDAQAQKRLQEEAARRMGQWYHLGFNLDSRHQFCSKFVYEVYRDALGVHVGTIESFRELLHRNPVSPLAFWRIWFLGRIPWERRTITPGSQYQSDLLETVCENRTCSVSGKP